MTLATALTAIAISTIGGIFPDLDQHTSDAWDHLPAGSVVARMIQPLIGNHRGFSHSLVGMGFFGFLCYQTLGIIGRALIVDVSIVWIGFMIGYASHLLADALTTEGVPFLLPLTKVKFGFPPVKFLRIKTSSFMESGLFYPGLLLLNGYLVYSHYQQYVAILKGFVK